MSQPKSPKICNYSYYRTLSLNLKYYRNRLELTQEQTAAKAEISVKYLSQIESSSFNYPPTLEVLFDLANALGVEPFQLFREL
ncbi:helix-turn-helix domain-containing protein [Qiania dongpingensis]|uniref:Helix-turn-helix transcriptional regulator n=1 Tax=Qiania dongpingensis TaxID=2763669 RepID=A0A7G9G561_9FIRM|nr:helix-turn-helix transcriptional regulator [Qiania dongpingensis]QNM05943.1 helix-turn-helix transcriptional regulator [Qiania dongpingensis]